MALSAFATVSEDPNRSGRASFYELPIAARYRRISSNQLSSEFLRNAISSASLYSVQGGSALVLFSSAPFGFSPDYTGSFLQLAGGEAVPVIENNFSTRGFDNMATSALLIGTKRGPETRLSFRAIFLDKWNELIKEKLMGSDAAPKGDPLLTWSMFPEPTMAALNSDLTYLRVFQALDVSVRVGPLVTYHYDAAIGFYIFLYVDVRNRLQAFVAGYEVWVQSGFYHDEVEKRLREKAAVDGVAALNSNLASEIRRFSGVPLADVYYLPGDQTATPPAVLTGSTYSDVTIVLERVP